MGGGLLRSVCEHLVRAMAIGAGCNLVADRTTTTGFRSAELGQVSGNVLHILFRQRRRIGVHGAMPTLAVGVAPERRDQVFSVLAAQLGYLVDGIGILVIRYEMAASAGIADDPAALGVAIRPGGNGNESQPQGGQSGYGFQWAVSKYHSMAPAHQVPSTRRVC